MSETVTCFSCQHSRSQVLLAGMAFMTRENVMHVELRCMKHGGRAESLCTDFTYEPGTDEDES